MNSDTKTTVLGWVKAIAKIVGTFVAAETIGADGFAEMVLMLVASAWGLIDIIMGYFTNKTSKQ